MFHFRQSLSLNTNGILKQNETRSFSSKSLIMIKAVHYVKSKKASSNLVNIKFYLYDEISQLDLYHFKRLIPNDENYPSFKNFIATKITERSVFRIGKKLYEIDFKFTNASFDDLKMVNNYYEFSLRENGSSTKVAIKFPLNIAANNLTLLNHQTIRMKSNQTETISLRNVFDSDCSWFLANVNLEIPCTTKLKLKHDAQLDEQNFIVYPHVHKSNFYAFSRVVLVKNESFLDCKNGGISASELSQKCACFPGLYGDFCEKSCPKGYVGESCEVECPDSAYCKGYLICSDDPIGCSCASGYTGYACDTPCSSNKWGPDCKLNCDHCANDACDRFTGDCICSTNFVGE